MRLFKSFPNTAALLLLVICFCAGLTYIVPAGSFERARDEKSGRTVVVAGTFQYVEQQPVGLRDIMASVFNGLLKAGDITRL